MKSTIIAIAIVAALSSTAQSSPKRLCVVDNPRLPEVSCKHERHSKRSLKATKSEQKGTKGRSKPDQETPMEPEKPLPPTEAPKPADNPTPPSDNNTPPKAPAPETPNTGNSTPNVPTQGTDTKPPKQSNSNDIKGFDPFGGLYGPGT
jgi:hypothetical protein